MEMRPFLHKQVDASKAHLLMLNSLDTPVLVVHARETQAAFNIHHTMNIIHGQHTSVSEDRAREGFPGCGQYLLALLFLQYKSRRAG